MTIPLPKLKSLARQKISQTDAAKILGVSRQRIHQIKRQHKIKFTSWKGRIKTVATPELDRVVKILITKIGGVRGGTIEIIGDSIHDLKRECGCTVGTLYRAAKRIGCEFKVVKRKYPVEPSDWTKPANSKRWTTEKEEE